VATPSSSSPDTLSGNGRKEPKPFSMRTRVGIILAEFAVVFTLLGVWVFSEEVRQSTSLWVLFFYSFPSEFLVGLVPHEPVLVFYGTHHPALTVAVVSVVSTVMAEGMNYALFSLFYGMPTLQKVLDGGSVRKVADLFNKAPFFAILFAGFTPVPFFPVRFLVVITGYPVWKYLLGVFLSRGPRFYILALIGYLFEIPTSVILGLFLAMVLLINVPSVAKVLKDSQGRNGG
jgi:membrane protein YqaA with SNARE-associated domain